MRTKIAVLLAGVLLGVVSAGTAFAERFVVVNGQRLSQEDIFTLERLHCGPIANGNYWLNFDTGIWGYAGNPTPQGHITDNCHRAERRPSLSERGMLFNSYDWWR